MRTIATLQEPDEGGIHGDIEALSHGDEYASADQPCRASGQKKTWIDSSDFNHARLPDCGQDGKERRLRPLGLIRIAAGTLPSAPSFP
jgi:hypothetical protein